MKKANETSHKIFLSKRVQSTFHFYIGCKGWIKVQIIHLGSSWFDLFSRRSELCNFHQFTLWLLTSLTKIKPYGLIPEKWAHRPCTAIYDYRNVRRRTCTSKNVFHDNKILFLILDEYTFIYRFSQRTVNVNCKKVELLNSTGIDKKYPILDLTPI